MGFRVLCHFAVLVIFIVDQNVIALILLMFRLASLLFSIQFFMVLFISALTKIFITSMVIFILLPTPLAIPSFPQAFSYGLIQFSSHY